VSQRLGGETLFVQEKKSIRTSRKEACGSSRFACYFCDEPTDFEAHHEILSKHRVHGIRPHRLFADHPLPVLQVGSEEHRAGHGPAECVFRTSRAQV